MTLATVCCLRKHCKYLLLIQIFFLHSPNTQYTFEIMVFLRNFVGNLIKLFFTWILSRHFCPPTSLLRPLFLVFHSLNVSIWEALRATKDDDDGNEASQGTIWILCHTPAAIRFNKWLRIFVRLSAAPSTASYSSAYCKVSISTLWFQECSARSLDSHRAVLSKAYFTFMDFRWLISHWWIVQ